MSRFHPASHRPVAGRRAVLALGGAALAGGCTTYAPREAALPAPSAAVQATIAEGARDGVALVAEPLSDPAGQVALFGGELRRVGTLAVLVTVRNGGTTPFPVRVADFQLDPGGDIPAIRTTPAALVAERMRAESGERGAAIAGVFFFGILGAAVASASSQQAADARRNDFEAKGLRDAELAPGTQLRGALFFVMPAGMPAFDTATLELRPRIALPPLRVPLTGLAYRPPR